MDMRLERGILSRIISGAIEKFLKKKLGYSIVLDIEEAEVNKTDNDGQRIHLSINGYLSKDELTKIQKDLGL